MIEVNSRKSVLMHIRHGNSYHYTIDGTSLTRGEWEGDSIEIVNSNASIAMGLQEAVSLPSELFHDNQNCSEKKLNADYNSHIDAVQNLTKDPDALDAEALFASFAKSKPPPRAFNGKLETLLFFAPELLPSEQFSWKPNFGGECPGSKFNTNTASIVSPQQISSNADEPLRPQNDSRNVQASTGRPDCSPKQFSFPQISHPRRHCYVLQVERYIQFLSYSDNPRSSTTQRLEDQREDTSIRETLYCKVHSCTENIGIFIVI